MEGAQEDERTDHTTLTIEETLRPTEEETMHMDQGDANQEDQEIDMRE